jgi:hypothetical protein
MSLETYLTSLRQCGIEVTAEDDRLRVEAPTGCQPPATPSWWWTRAG